MAHAHTSDGEDSMSPLLSTCCWQLKASPSVLALALLALLSTDVRAEDPLPAGLIMPVRADRMEGVASRLEQLIKKPLRRFEVARGYDPARKERFTLVCDFNPDGHAAASDKYE